MEERQVKFFPKNTLAHFNAAPQVRQHDLSTLPTAVLASSSQEYKKSCNQASPDEEAVSFYTLNHCASIVRESFTVNEPLPEWAREIMQTYTDVMMAQGERMLHYILCITTRETRHLKSCTPAFWSKVGLQFGQASVDILKNISNDGNEDTAMNKYLKTPPEMTIGQYVNTLAYAFHKAGSSGWSSSYGGKPWGEVTDAVVSMVQGTTSMEMLVDTGYTLAHNGGPIFNKGMMYAHYSGNFMTILDVQRSGQMLDLMMETQTLGIKKTAEATFAADLIKAHRPDKLKGYVDWKLVDALRPEKDKSAHPNKYSKLTAAQKQAVAPKPKTVKPTMAPAQAASSDLTSMFGKKVKKVGTWQVFPHQSVDTYARVENV